MFRSIYLKRSEFEVVQLNVESRDESTRIQKELTDTVTGDTV